MDDGQKPMDVGCDDTETLLRLLDDHELNDLFDEVSQFYPLQSTDDSRPTGTNIRSSMESLAQPSLDDLPDSILLQILSNLPVKELCTAGRVCWRWRRIENDNSLWRHVDLSPYQLELHDMRQVIRAHFSSALLSLKVRGFWDTHTGVSKTRKQSLSNAMLRDLKERCPSIVTLCLYSCYTSNIDASNLPSTLHTLVINQSSWKEKWLEGVMATKSLPNLTHLDVSGCFRFDDTDLKYISNSGLKLKVLIMKNCYRLGERALADMANKLTDLETLEMSEMRLSEFSCDAIGRNLTNLKRLNIADNLSLKGNLLEAITSATLKLEYLNISHCPNISQNDCACLEKLKDLKTLVVGRNVDIRRIFSNPLFRIEQV